MVVLVATGVPVRSLERSCLAWRCPLPAARWSGGMAMRWAAGGHRQETQDSKETQNVRSEEREDSRYELYVYGLIALIYEAHSLLDQGVPFDLHSLRHASRPSGFTV